jgi:glycine/D-amino acid oxidase-like deaminating enzyme
MSPIDTSSTSTVIVGSGIIGLSTAYFLSESGNTDPKNIHLVDASSDLFRCASGFAGGFLAADCKLGSLQPRQTSTSIRSNFRQHAL